MLYMASSGVLCADRCMVHVECFFLWEYVARYYAIADYGTTQQSVDMRWLTYT
jgi:hypothetical protein